MQRPPLPVDVVSTIPDYIVDMADILAGLGTAGALIVAALAYRRQVDDARRSQAVKVDFDLWPNDGTSWLIRLVNRGDEPVYEVQAVVGRRDGNPSDTHATEAGLLAPHGQLVLADSVEAEMPDELVVSASFTDASGHRWFRSRDGGLHEDSRQTWLQRILQRGR